jgi:hypothetical protein
MVPNKLWKNQTGQILPKRKRRIVTGGTTSQNENQPRSLKLVEGCPLSLPKGAAQPNPFVDSSIRKFVYFQGSRAVYS